MNIVRRNKTNKKNVRFSWLAASFIMFGYWYGTKTENEEDNSNSLALSQSFGFFDTVSNKEWKLLQKITAEHINEKTGMVANETLAELFANNESGERSSGPIIDAVFTFVNGR